jgi:hypothetical protein
MKCNVGPTERIARLAIGAAAGVAAMQTRGWPRAVLATVAVSGLTTGTTRYCPVNQALGLECESSRLDEGRQNAEIRRDTAVRSALGLDPSGAADTPPMARNNDQFGRTSSM